MVEVGGLGVILPRGLVRADLLGDGQPEGRDPLEVFSVDHDRHC